jgi:hypothetical protein
VIRARCEREALDRRQTAQHGPAEARMGDAGSA